MIIIPSTGVKIIPFTKWRGHIGGHQPGSAVILERSQPWERIGYISSREFIFVWNETITRKTGKKTNTETKMAPSAIIDSIVDTIEPKKDNLELPEPARERLTKAGIDLSNGYPYRPAIPRYLQDVYKIRGEERPYVDRGAKADKSKKHLFAAATKVTDLTTHIGTEIEGVQLKDLTPEQRDELALLIAERSVVFLRNQDLTPQQQKELGEYYGQVEVHVSNDHQEGPLAQIRSYSDALSSLKRLRSRGFPV